MTEIIMKVLINLEGYDCEFLIKKKWAIELMNRKRITRKHK